MFSFAMNCTRHHVVVCTLKTISMVNTTVKTWFMMSSSFLSIDHGGMLGLSMASVMQLAEINERMMKSNQFWLVSFAHQILNLSSGLKSQKE